ncbi:MAG: SDR family oxidoreductase, partial [Candidatus Obscuribacterales bacterium]
MSAEPITVLVDGATGYLGSHLAASLCRREGFRVRCLVREKANPADIAFLESLPVEVVRADIPPRPEDADKLAAIFEGVGAIVHLIGSIAPGRNQSFEALHQGITNAMINYARHYSIP